MYDVKSLFCVVVVERDGDEGLYSSLAVGRAHAAIDHLDRDIKGVAT